MHPSIATLLKIEAEFKVRGKFLALAISTFFMNFGFYLVIPYLAVHLTRDLGMSAFATGVVLGVRLFTQRGFSVVGGYLSDSLNPQLLAGIGCIIRASGFFAFSFSDNLPFLILAAVFSGFGGSLFSPAINVMLAQIEEREKTNGRFFSWINSIDNTAMIVGPLAGTALINQGFGVVCMVAGAVFVLSGVWFIAWSISAANVVDENKSQGEKMSLSTFVLGVKSALNNRKFMNFLIILLPFPYSAQQIYLLVPSFAIGDAGRQTGLIFSFYAVASVLCSAIAGLWSRKIFDSWLLGGAIGTGLVVLAATVGCTTRSIYGLYSFSFLLACGVWRCNIEPRIFCRGKKIFHFRVKGSLLWCRCSCRGSGRDGE